MERWGEVNESHIRQQIREWLQIHGWYVVLMVASPVSHKGIPDLMAYGPKGERLDIEVKTAKGRQSDEQKAYQEEIERRGHQYVLARCLEDVMDLTTD